MKREGGSILIPMIMIGIGYIAVSYGWVLIKGWDISFRQWVSPLNPYQWPANGGNPPAAPATRVFPAGAGGSGGHVTAT